MTTTHTILPTGIWKLDATNTDVSVTVKKLKLITVTADIALTDGSITIDDNGAVTGVNVVLDATSFQSGNDKRDEHVRSADFLDAENHPHLSFTATKAEPTATGYSASGMVTVKGVSHPLSFDISTINIDNSTGSFTATASADRNALGVDKMPSLVIGRELQVSVSARADLTS